MAEAKANNKAKITVDGVEYESNPDNNLLQECLSKGLDLPYFCWHPCMGSVGACRQCAVKQYRNEEDEQGMVVMACMTPAVDGSIISIKDEQAATMRARVIESLMINHPHDCPVCEEGGECHLQDMTLMSGHNYRRYDKKKRTHHNQYLGPFINHEMNRCIACYRCVRYYDDYAGGTDLAAQASHHHVYFGRHQDGVLESEFSGNLVEVCPTGVFTDRVFSEHYTRKWDLQVAPSVCNGCSVGCNTTPGERYGTLRRVVNRYNSEVNGYFLCDRGRFGFEYVNGAERLSQAQRQEQGAPQALSSQETSTLMNEFRGEDCIGIGSPRASNEANYALRRLVGEDNFYAGVSETEQEINQLILGLNRDPAFHNPSIREIEQCDAILILGEDVTNVAPRISLALRQSVHNRARELAANNHIPQWQDAAVRELAQHDRSPLFIFSPYATRLDDVAEDVLIERPSVLASQAFAIATAIGEGAPGPSPEDEAVRDRAQQIAEALAAAKRPLIIAGSNSLNIALVQAASNIARALAGARDKPLDLCLLVPEANTLGLTLLAAQSNDLGAALERMESGKARRAIVVENDLYRRAPTARIDGALAKLESLLVIDQLPTATTARANYVLPCTAFSEQEASTLNYEGRAQLSFQVHRNHSAAQPAWQWLVGSEIASVEELIEDCAEHVAGMDHLDELLPDLDQFTAAMKLPRQSHRYSGRTAMKAHVNVHEPKQAVDLQSPFAFSMEGLSPLKEAQLMGASWAPGWNSNQSISKFQEEIGGELRQGHSGQRLLAKADGLDYFTPPDQNGKGDGMELALAWQIFGSEELTARSPAIQQRMTDPFVCLSTEDAKDKGIAQGDLVELRSGENSYPLVACIRERMKPGTVALYCGDNEINPWDLGSHVTVEKGEAGAAESGRGIAGLIVSDLYEEGY